MVNCIALQNLSINQTPNINTPFPPALLTNIAVKQFHPFDWYDADFDFSVSHSAKGAYLGFNEGR